MKYKYNDMEKTIVKSFHITQYIFNHTKGYRTIAVEINCKIDC